MTRTQGQTESIWMNVSMPMTPPLQEDAAADVCIIGAGIAGVTAAYHLTRAGRSVIVLDDSAIGGGETGRTTAHLACEIDDRVHSIERMHGRDVARLAVQSHMMAINRIEELVTLENIDCQFERLPGYLMRGADTPADDLEREYDAARRAGLTDVEWVERAPIVGFDSGRCLRFPNQATFHPLRYIRALARAVMQQGGRIHCGTHVNEDFDEGSMVRVFTRDGRTVTAQSVVVATNSPALNFLEVHAKQTAMRTYVVAFAVPRGLLQRALIWDNEDPYHYIRVHSDPTEQDDYLIVGGADHKTGQDDDPEHRFNELERWTRQRFPTVGKVERRWSGQVLEPIDGLAYIGRFERGARNIYCISGDSGQGMTHGTMGGMIVSDLILGRENPYADLYAPSRKTLAATGEFLSEQGNNVRQYADWITPGEIETEAEVAPNSGAVIRRGIRKIAVYRDPGGAVHEMSAACTHLGCVVNWNPVEHTWDCPCHGSRFNPVGVVINGPATDNLRPIEQPIRTSRR